MSLKLNTKLKTKKKMLLNNKTSKEAVDVDESLSTDDSKLLFYIR